MTNPELVALIADKLPRLAASLTRDERRAVIDDLANALDGKVVMRSELEAAQARIEELETALRDTADELAKWGVGDWGYGSQEQVSEQVAAARALLRQEARDDQS